MCINSILYMLPQLLAFHFKVLENLAQEYLVLTCPFTVIMTKKSNVKVELLFNFCNSG